MGEYTPQIRFKGFTDEWEEHHLSEVASEVKGNDGRTELPVLTISAANGWMNQKDRFSTVIAGTELKNYTLLKKGQLSYNHGNSKLAKYGAVFSLESYSEALVPRVYHSFTVNGKADAKFIEYLFATKLPDRELGKLVSSGARMDGLLNINKTEFMGIKLKFPNLAEQTKISKILSTLDNVIAANQRQLDLLKEQKKGFLQKMFPKQGAKVPELRFAGFDDDWEERKLGDISGKVTEKNSDNEFSETLTNSAEYGIISQRDFFDKDISNEKNLNTYYVVRDGDFVYNPRISNFAPVGPIKRNTLGRIGVMSPLYYVFRARNVDGMYLEKYFSSTKWHRFMELNGDTGARADRFAIKDKDFVQMPILLPTLEEQSKIARFLDSVDTTITLQQRKLDLLKEQKKALLQKMFV